MNIIKDKSPQGFKDPDIIPLLDILNKKYTTTSSCSGRITLMDGNKKGDAKWIFKTHTIANTQEIYEIIQNHTTNILRLFYEPLIIHLKCKNMNEADILLTTLHQNGFKKPAVISVKTITVEINDTGRMETIVTKNLSIEYIELIINETNKRLQKTKNNIKKLELLFA